MSGNTTGSSWISSEDKNSKNIFEKIAVFEDLEPEIIITDRLFEFNTDLFGINEMSEEERKKNARIVAGKIAEMI